LLKQREGEKQIGKTMITKSPRSVSQLLVTKKGQKNAPTTLDRQKSCPIRQLQLNRPLKTYLK